QRHAGSLLPLDSPAFDVKPTNITPDRDTGIGAWSEADIKRSLTDGVRPDHHTRYPGAPLAPAMPWPYYKIFTPGDLDAVVAYLRSVPAIKNETPAPVYKAPMAVDIVPGAEKPMSEAELRDPVKRGFYLVTIAHCMECHTPITNGRQDFPKTMGQGGREFPGPWGMAVSRNITSHREKGLGAWSDAEIKRAITQGVRRDGTPLKPPMGYAWYARVSDDDLNAVVAYLRTLPPLE
ncbi:MAG TPA: c-type cytochrome, partial [Xanthobacteraceae bacterium]